MQKKFNTKFAILFFLISFLLIFFPCHSIQAGCCKDLKVAPLDCPNADILICKNANAQSECAPNFWLGSDSCSNIPFCKEIGCCKTITPTISCEKKSRMDCANLNFSCFYLVGTCEQISGCIDGEIKGCCIIEHEDDINCTDDTNSSNCLSITTYASKQYRKSGRCIEESICGGGKQTTKKLEKLTQTKPSLPLNFIPSVTIPGSTFVAGQAIPVSGNLIGQYISAIFEFFVVISAVLAVVMIMIAGILWLIAAGSSDKITKARKMIGNAIIGLTLSLATYTILSLINPNLVILKNINLTPIERIELKEEELTPEEMPENSELVSVSGLEYSVFISSVSIPFLRKDTAEKLKEAAIELHNEGEILQINNAYRTFENQVNLYNQFCKQQYNNSCPPKEQRGCSQDVCCPIKGQARCAHETGRAVDVSCKGKNTNDPCQKKVQQAMKNAGFCKSKSEAWHYEYPGYSNWCVKDF